MTREARRRSLGSRYLYEPFDSAHARIEINERVFEERWTSLARNLEHIENGLERVERRLWYAVFGVAAAMAGQILAFLFATRLIQ